MKRNVLLIGVGGFLGQHILKNAGHCHECILVPVFHTPMSGATTVDVSDNRSIENLFAATNPACAINLTCLPVAVCEQHPDTAYAVQAIGVKNLAQVCASTCRLIHLSSDMVFSGRKGSYYLPNDVPDPISVYGKTKAEGEGYVSQYAQNYAIIRSALILGRDPRGTRGFIEWMLGNVNKRVIFPLFSDQYRTPIVIDDLVSMIISLINDDFIGTLHAGGDQRINRVGMGQWLCEGLGLTEIPYEEIMMSDSESRSPMQKDLSMDNSLIKYVCNLTCTDTKKYIIALGRREYEESRTSTKTWPNHCLHQ